MRKIFIYINKKFDNINLEIQDSLSNNLRLHINILDNRNTLSNSFISLNTYVIYIAVYYDAHSLERSSCTLNVLIFLFQVVPSKTCFKESI